MRDRWGILVGGSVVVSVGIIIAVFVLAGALWAANATTINEVLS